jgi:hypothetical protein
MLKRRPLKAEKAGAGYTFPVELSTLGGTIVALYPTNPGAVRVKAPKRLAAGLTYGITVDLLDKENNPLRGLQPLELSITDPGGNANASSDYYCAENGRLTVEFVPALNDTRGRWTASVLDLTAGLRAETNFKVVD